MINIIRHHILVTLDDATEADEAYRRAKAIGIELALDKRIQDAVEYGTVVQVGPTAYKDLGFNESPVKVGDRVSLTRYTGKKVADSDGKVYHLFNDDDVLCIVK